MDKVFFPQEKKSFKLKTSLHIPCHDFLNFSCHLPGAVCPRLYFGIVTEHDRPIDAQIFNSLCLIYLNYQSNILHRQVVEQKLVDPVISIFSYLLNSF